MIGSNTALLAAIPLVVWIGVFFYLLMMDRKIARLERGEDGDDL